MHFYWIIINEHIDLSYIKIVIGLGFQIFNEPYTLFIALTFPGILSLSACIAIGSVDMICVSKTVRKRITRKAQIWFDITMASVLCLTWILVLISCAFSIRLIRHRRPRFDADHLMEKYTLLTMVLSLIVITAQVGEKILILISLVTKIKSFW